MILNSCVHSYALSYKVEHNCRSYIISHGKAHTCLLVYAIWNVYSQSYTNSKFPGRNNDSLTPLRLISLMLHFNGSLHVMHMHTHALTFDILIFVRFRLCTCSTWAAFAWSAHRGWSVPIEAAHRMQRPHIEHTKKVVHTFYLLCAYAVTVSVGTWRLECINMQFTFNIQLVFYKCSAWVIWNGGSRGISHGNVSSCHVILVWLNLKYMSWMNWCPRICLGRLAYSPKQFEEC